MLFGGEVKKFFEEPLFGYTIIITVTVNKTYSQRKKYCYIKIRLNSFALQHLDED